MATTPPPKFESAQLIKFLTTNSQGKSYATIAGTIILLVVMFLLGVFPTVSTILQQISINGNRATYLAKLESNLSALRTLGQQQTALAPEVETLNELLPTQLPQVEIVAEVAEMSEALSVNLTGVSFSDMDSRRNLFREIKVDKKVSGHQVKISVEGPKQNLIDLVARLEASHRVFNLTSVALVAVDTRSGVPIGTFQLDLTAEFYYWDIEV